MSRELLRLLEAAELDGDQAAGAALKAVMPALRGAALDHPPRIRADPAVPCWRFLAGSAAYFGPVPVEDGERLVLGPASLALLEDAPCAAWEQANIEAVWPRWDKHEQGLYVEVRAAGLAVASAWAVVHGVEPAAFCGGLEVRLMAARFAANAVDRLRGWRYAVMLETGARAVAARRG